VLVVDRSARAGRGIRLGEAEVKRRVLSALEDGSLNANSLSTSTNVSRVTLTKRLPPLLRDEYIVRDPKSRAYHLGERGRHELDRLREMKWFEEHSHEVYLSGVIEGKLDVLEPFWIGRIQLEGSPTPIPMPASIYVSREFADNYDRGEAFLKYHDGLGPKKARAVMLEGTMGDLAQQFMLRNLAERCLNLAEWHKSYEFRDTRAKPPPFNLESILGFNFGVTFRYNGKGALRRWSENPLSKENLREQSKAKHRLVSFLLIRMALGTEGTAIFSSRDYLDLMKDGGLISPEEARELKKLYDNMWTRVIVKKKRERGIARYETRHTGPRGSLSFKKAQDAFLKIALRHLWKGEGLATPPSMPLDDVYKYALKEPELETISDEASE